MMDRNHKTVLVTGASSGFGKLLGRRFLEGGWRVVATLRNAHERLEVFSDERKQFGDRLRILPLDVTSRPERDEVARVLSCDYYGRLDLLVNNAGYGLFGALEDLDEEQLRHQMEVNFFGAAMLTRGVLPYLRIARGRIINVSSICGRIALPLSSAYCASKFALEGLTESLYFELLSHGVQVALVEPGGFRTRFGGAVRWGAQSFSESAYREETDGYLSLRNRLASRENPPDPAKVSERIFRLAEARKMPLRTVIGKDAGQLTWIRRLLPECFYLPLMRALFGKRFKDSRVVRPKELAHEPSPYTLSD